MRSAFNNRGYRPYMHYSNPYSIYDEQDGTDLQTIKLWDTTCGLSKACIINNSENQFANMPSETSQRYVSRVRGDVAHHQIPKAKSSMLYTIPLSINSCTNDINNLFQNYCVYQANGYMACSKTKTTLATGLK